MGRAPCCDRMGLKKGPWTAEEDKVLVDFVRRHGHGNWRALPRQAGLLRCGKSCRLRWTNYLRPDIKRGNFSVEEEDTVIKLHQLLGNRWSAIAARLPGRTDNEIKNVWNTHLKKRLLRMGIDPVTHRATMPSSSVAQRNGYNFNSVEHTAPSMRDSDASVDSTSTSLYTSGEFGCQPLSEFENEISAIKSPRRQVSSFSNSFPDASSSPTEHFSSTGSMDNETTSTVDSTLTSVPAKENKELNACMDSVDMEGLACNQMHPATVENQFNCEDDFFINEPFVWVDEWPALSHESNEIPRSQEKSDRVSSLQPDDSMSVYREGDDLFRELQSNMVDSCTSPFHQLWNMQLQKDDDCIDFWLNMLGQAGPLPSLYQHLTSQA